jgi:heme-degrading monooxygenase HmoA
VYARIATFEGAGPEQREAAERLTREEFIPRTRELQGYAGYLSLYDADAERAVSIVLFDDEDSLRGGDQALDAMSPPDELRGIRRTGVDKYEVVMHEIRGEASAARFSRLEGPPERIDDGMSHARDSIIPRAQQLSGWRGFFGLADRQSGRVAIITLWDSRESLQASEQQADELRKESAEAGGETIKGVERYEVVSQDVAAGASV